MTRFTFITLLSSATALTLSCTTVSRTPMPSPASFVTTDQPIAVMPFESQDARSNLGGQVSDALIAELLELNPQLKIIPATAVRNYMLKENMGTAGILDAHAIHNSGQGLQCRYLLTGNVYTSIGSIQYTSDFADRVATGGLTIRLVDCETTAVVWAKHIQSDYMTPTYYSTETPHTTTYLTDGQLIQSLIRVLAHDGASSFLGRN